MSESRAAAFSEVFRESHGDLLAFCFRRVDDYEVARDLTAETFRIAWSRWDEPRRSDRAWLFGVARNLIGNEYTRRRTRPSVPRAPARPPQLHDLRADAAFTAVDVQGEHLDALTAGPWLRTTGSMAVDAAGVGRSAGGVLDQRRIRTGRTRLR